MAVAQEVLLKQIKLEQAKQPEYELDPEKSYEIVNGQPEEKEMPGARHGGVAARLIIRLGNYVESNNLGSLYSEASFIIGQNERIPDVAFVASDRIPPEGEPATLWPMAPDLAIEVISPNDIYLKVMSKTDDYFAAGVKQVWLVDPELRIISVYRSLTDVTIFAEENELASEDLFPGFCCRLNEIFKTPAKSPKS